MKLPQKKYWLVLALLTATLAGMALFPSGIQDQQLTATLRANPKEELASCAPSDERYKNLFFRSSPSEEWSEEYHRQVNAVVKEYLHTAQTIACTENNVLPITEESTLYQMAKNLPPWQQAENLQKLTRSDVGFVLLEFLRIYECALLDGRNFIQLYAREKTEREVQAGQLPPNMIENPTYWGDQTALQSLLPKIEQELRTARPTLEKTLQVLAGTVRLALLDAEVACAQGAFLDMRNAFALAADASSCLPRIWNARDVLRDIAN